MIPSKRIRPMKCIPSPPRSQPSREQQHRGEFSTSRARMVTTRARMVTTRAQNFKWKRCIKLGTSLIILATIIGSYFPNQGDDRNSATGRFFLPAHGHIVLTRDDRGQSLVLTGEDGKGGKGGGGDQLVITGQNMGGGGQNSNMVLQDAENREGDVVINGNSMIVPGEDGHIVLADNRNKHDHGPPPPPPNLFAFWMPYLNNRMAYRMMPFFSNQFG